MSSLPASRCDEQLTGRAQSGLKLHEDWGTTPASIDNCLSRSRPTRMSRWPFTPTRSTNPVLSRRRFAAFKGRARSIRSTPKGQVAATRPDIIKACGVSPTCPAVVNQPDPALHRQHDRRASRHADGLPPSGPRYRLRTSHLPKARIRRETIAAEDILHDLGAFSMISSDSAGHGTCRRSHHPNLADRAQDEAPTRRAGAAIRPATITCAMQAVRGQVHDQSGASLTASPI